VEDAAAAGLARTRVVRDEITAVEIGGDSYRLLGRGGTLAARRVVIAAGSAPVLPRLASAPGGVTVVDDPFLDMTRALDRISTAVRRRVDRPAHIVLLGANAGTMDMLYQISNSPAPEVGRAVFTVLTPSGRLPEKLGDPDPATPFIPPHLTAMRDAELPIRAEGLYQAAVADIERGRLDGRTVADTLLPVTTAVSALVARLSPDETLEFAARWGVELGRHQRRAGWEYSEVAEQLFEQGRLRVVAGAFTRLTAAADGSAHVHFRAGGEPDDLETSADVVVNCAGPARHLGDAVSPLLGQLLSSGVCRTTRYGAGLVVDPDLSAAPGVYVMGPLLAGNVVRGGPVWHMEHCGRISSFGSALGHDLARELVAVDAHLAQPS